MLIVLRQVRSTGFLMAITERAKMHTRYAGLTMPTEERGGISHRAKKDECGNGEATVPLGEP